MLWKLDSDAVSNAVSDALQLCEMKKITLLQGRGLVYLHSNERNTLKCKNHSTKLYCSFTAFFLTCSFWWWKRNFFSQYKENGIPIFFYLFLTEEIFHTTIRSGFIFSICLQFWFQNYTVLLKDLNPLHHWGLTSHCVKEGKYPSCLSMLSCLNGILWVRWGKSAALWINHWRNLVSPTGWKGSGERLQFWPDRLFSISTYLSLCICLKTLCYRLALNKQASKKHRASLAQRVMQETVSPIPSHQVEQELVQGMKGQQNMTSCM